MTPPGYTVPANFIVVVRDVDVYSGGGSIIDWEWGVATANKIGGGQFTVLSVPQFQTWRGRQVVLAGETIYFQSNGATDGAMSGYLLVAGP
jgi:hypothetical protein